MFSVNSNLVMKFLTIRLGLARLGDSCGFVFVIFAVDNGIRSIWYYWMLIQNG